MAAKEEVVLSRGVLLKGLPFQTTVSEIKSFFKSLVIPPDSIRVIKFPDGSASGLAFVKLEDEEEIKHALLMDRNHMGSRYIEVRVSDESELYYLMLRARSGATRNELYKISGHGEKHDFPMYKYLETKFAYITGVPRGSQYKEIRSFFAGRLIGRGKIWLLREPGSGQFRGDGYIEFANNEECLLAMQRDGKLMGDSVIHVEPCTMEEAEEWSEGNLGGAGGRDLEYRQSRSWKSEGDWGGSRGRDRGSERGDRQVGRRDRDRKRTPSPARRRREMYTATYGFNTILREDDPYGEPLFEQGGPEPYPFDHAEPSGGYSSSQYRSSPSHSGHYGAALSGSASGRGPMEASGGSYRRGGGTSYESYLSAAYGGHATVARQTERSFAPVFSGGVAGGGASARPLMGVATHDSLPASFQEKKVVRVEGLPYDVSVPQILDFFHGYDLNYDDVRIQCRDDGSPSGKAFITFPSDRHARVAIQQLNRRYINGRYVELILV